MEKGDSGDEVTLDIEAYDLHNRTIGNPGLALYLQLCLVCERPGDRSAYVASTGPALAIDRLRLFLILQSQLTVCFF